MSTDNLYSPRKPRYAVVLFGPEGQGSFNESGLRGAHKARDAGHEVDVLWVAGQSAQQRAAEMSALCGGRYALILAHGGQGDGPVQILAERWPEQAFAVTQGSWAAPNVARYEVLQEQSAFLAGVLAVAPLAEFDLADFDRTLAVNVRSVFVASQAAARHMGQGGRIINIGSTNAERMPFGGGGPYAMSKAALVGLTKGLARDLGPRGITINNVQPGPVDTDMNPADGESAEQLKGMMALARYGKDEEIASFVAYLAGPEAGYITGASLTIDGGFSA